MKQITLSRPVWIIEERTMGNLLKEGSFYSLVEWVKDNVYYQEFLSSEEFSEIDEYGILYEIDEFE
jgi:hypothetical protein